MVQGISVGIDSKTRRAVRVVTDLFVPRIKTRIFFIWYESANLHSWNAGENKIRLRREEMDLFSTIPPQPPTRLTFRDVKRMRACETGNRTGMWFYCMDVFKALENNSGKNYILQKCSKYDYTCLKKVTHEWDSVNASWMTASSPDPILMIPARNLQECCLSILHRVRKTCHRKLELLRRFQIELTEEEIKTFIKVPIECAVLDVFVNACPFQVETQYRIGKYRLDAYIPRLKIAIEIDERGHTSYDQGEEKMYNTVLRDHNIVCLRFVPDEKRPVPSGLKLVSMVWRRTLSPDFKTFSADQQLY
jgi:hypothetical protein